MESIERIIIHCTDTPDTRDVTCQDLFKWHVTENRWKAIGYHYFIDLFGIIYLTRPESIQGAGVHGHNKGALQICYAGGRRTTTFGNVLYSDTRNDGQRHAMFLLIAYLLRKYPTIHEIVGHRDLSTGKQCPCFNAGREYSWLLDTFREIECPAPVIVPFVEMDAAQDDIEVIR